MKMKIAILNTTPATRFGRVLLIIFGVFDQRVNFKFVTKVVLSCTFAIGASDIAEFTLDTLGAKGKRTICALFRLVGVTPPSVSGSTLVFRVWRSTGAPKLP